MHRPPGRGARRAPRRARPAGRPARRAGPAARGRGGSGGGVGRGRAVRPWCGGAAPYAGLEREAFDEVVELVSWGITTGRGRRGAHLHRDGVHGRLRAPARRPARRADRRGAIPETGDYRVVLDPDGVTVGSVHEDFAVEANIGDVFLLGTHSWRVRQVEVGTVRVTDAGDTSPTVPFWLGRGAGAHDRALRGGRGAAGRPGRPPGRGRRRRGPGAVVRAVPGCRPRRPTRWWPTWPPGGPRSASCPPASAWSSSGASTRARAPSWSCTPPTGAASTAPSAWPCASGSASPSTSSCRRRPTTTRCSSRSAPSTASR